LDEEYTCVDEEYTCVEATNNRQLILFPFLCNWIEKQRCGWECGRNGDFPMQRAEDSCREGDEARSALLLKQRLKMELLEKKRSRGRKVVEARHLSEVN
jgi:hypothetical protein